MEFELKKVKEEKTKKISEDGERQERHYTYKFIPVVKEDEATTIHNVTVKTSAPIKDTEINITFEEVDA